MGIESQNIYVSLYDENAQEHYQIAYLNGEDEYEEVLSEPDRLEIHDFPYIEYAIFEYLKSQKIPFQLSFDGENHEVKGNGFNAHTKTRVCALAFVAIHLCEASR